MSDFRFSGKFPKIPMEECFGCSLLLILHYVMNPYLWQHTAKIYFLQGVAGTHIWQQIRQTREAAKLLVTHNTKDAPNLIIIINIFFLLQL